MLDGARILVAEDETLIAADLADHLEGFGAKVIGPVSTMTEGIRLASTEDFDTALLDFNLFDGDVTPLLDLLSSRSVAIVVYTGRGVPPELVRRHPRLTVVPKPTAMHRIVAELAAARERLSAMGQPLPATTTLTGTNPSQVAKAASPSARKASARSSTGRGLVA